MTDERFGAAQWNRTQATRDGKGFTVSCEDVQGSVILSATRGSSHETKIIQGAARVTELLTHHVGELDVRRASRNAFKQRELGA